MRANDILLNQPFTSHHKKRELVIEELRNSGCRITQQRKIILDIILNNECSCCKEIYYQAVHKDDSIGIATVYRMIKKLEEIGAIDRKNQYQVTSEKFDETLNERMILHKDEVSIAIKDEQWLEEIRAKLKEHGYINNEPVSVVFHVGNKQ
ncbi:transcriptional repressor [Clostridium sp. Marseille-P299]|uniref:transcriptional repressor n=1 Tax=Clostridium sp. Marseille-P299 TaxID=1805477 RepID=UPI0008343DA9|nr:transcriptional repressor [Clostridium sp. Marseille-P299]